MEQATGIDLCKALYEKLSPHGFFPALTGGLLYKEGSRKDCDIVIFRHRQNVQPFELVEIEHLLVECGFTDIRHHGFVTKANMGIFPVDIFNPESKNGTDEDTYGERA